MRILMSIYPNSFGSLEEFKANVSMNEYVYFMEHGFHMSAFPLMANHTQNCNYQKIIAQVIFYPKYT